MHGAHPGVTSAPREHSCNVTADSDGNAAVVVLQVDSDGKYVYRTITRSVFLHSLIPDVSKRGVRPAVSAVLQDLWERDPCIRRMSDSPGELWEGIVDGIHAPPGITARDVRMLLQQRDRESNDAGFGSGSDAFPIRHPPRAMLTVRDGVMLCSIMYMHAVITDSTVFLLLNDGMDDALRSVLDRLVAVLRLKHAAQAAPPMTPGEALTRAIPNQEPLGMVADELVDLPFELIVLESLLMAAATHMQTWWYSMETQLKALFAAGVGRPESVTETMVNRLMTFTDAGESLRGALLGVLNCSPDLRALVLSAAAETASGLAKSNALLLRASAGESTDTSSRAHNYGWENGRSEMRGGAVEQELLPTPSAPALMETLAVPESARRLTSMASADSEFTEATDLSDERDLDALDAQRGDNTPMTPAGLPLAQQGEASETMRSTVQSLHSLPPMRNVSELEISSATSFTFPIETSHTVRERMPRQPGGVGYSAPLQRARSSGSEFSDSGINEIAENVEGDFRDVINDSEPPQQRGRHRLSSAADSEAFAVATHGNGHPHPGNELSPAAASPASVPAALRIGSFLLQRAATRERMSGAADAGIAPTFGASTYPGLARQPSRQAIADERGTAMAAVDPAGALATAMLTHAIACAEYAEDLQQAAGAAEVLLEAYLMSVEALISKARSRQEEMSGMAHQAQLMMSARRNNLWVVQVALAGIMCLLAAQNLSGAYMGMNLGNASEPTIAPVHLLFLRIVAAGSGATVVLVLLLWLILRQQMFRWRGGWCCVRSHP